MENNQISNIIVGIIQTGLMSVPTLILIWNSYKKNKSSLAVRIIRKRKEIAKAELDSQNRREKLKIELASLEEEANYLSRMNKWECNTSAFGKDGESGELESEKSNKLSDLKEKSIQQIDNLKSKTDDLLKGGLDKVKDLKNRIPTFEKK